MYLFLNYMYAIVVFYLSKPTLHATVADQDSPRRSLGDPVPLHSSGQAISERGRSEQFLRGRRICIP